MILLKPRGFAAPLWLFYFIWAGLYLNLGIYYFMAAMITSDARAGAGENTPLPLVAIAPVAGAALLGGILLKRFALSKRRAAAFQATCPAVSENIDDASDPGQQAPATMFMRRNFILYVISMGMVHTCGMLGLIYAISTGSANTILPFLIAEAVSLVLCFPRVPATGHEAPDME